MSEQMSEQTKMRYILAVFNPQTSEKWFILNRAFVIQPTKDKKISGVFLSDMWFNYLLGENTDDFIKEFPNDITFMIIKTNIHNNYVLDDLNRNHFNYHISSPSLYDKPILSSDNSYYFVLEKDMINFSMQHIIKEKKDHMELTLKDKENYGVKLTFELFNIQNQLCISLPKFYLD